MPLRFLSSLASVIGHRKDFETFVTNSLRTIKTSLLQNVEAINRLEIKLEEHCLDKHEE
jgi:hypothetical protein